MKAKKLLLTAAVILSTFMFTGCIDIVENISYSDSNYNIGIRITLSKLLFAMANEDPDKFLNQLQSSDDIPENAEINPINSELEAGVYFKVKIDPQNATEEQKEFLPLVKKDGKVIIPVFLYDQNFSDIEKMDAESKGIAQAMLSTAKYRVNLSKKIISPLSDVKFVCESETHPVEYYDMGEMYCIEIPFILLMNGKCHLELSK